MKPRFAFAIGLVFVVIAVAYGLLSGDAGGTTMLGLLAVGMTLMWYVLFAGTQSGS